MPLFRFLNMALLLALTAGFNGPTRTPASKFSLSKVVMNNWASPTDAFRYGVGGDPFASSAAIDGSRAMTVTSLQPSSTRVAQLPAKGVVKSNVKNSATPTQEFRHGVGGEPLALTAAIDGSRAMSVTSTFQSSPRVAQLPARGVVKPSVRNSATPTQEFRHGVGGDPLAILSAIDGKSAMSVTSLFKSSSRVAQLSARGTVSPNVRNSASQTQAFRHGVGGESIATLSAIDGKSAMSVTSMKTAAVPAIAPAVSEE